MFTAPEEARIRQRLRRGNSPKRIALDYSTPDCPMVGVRAAIEAIRAQMLGLPAQGAGEAGNHQERAFVAGREAWWQGLSPDLQALVWEVCRRHSLMLSELHKGTGGKEARFMLAHALRHRWAMSYSQIGHLLDVGDLTAARWASQWQGKPPAASPPMPDLPNPVLPLALAVAGEYRLTVWALIKSGRCPDLAQRARGCLAVRLYTELGYTKKQINHALAGDNKTVQAAMDAYARARGLDARALDAQHQQTIKAQKQRQSPPAPKTGDALCLNTSRPLRAAPRCALSGTLRRASRCFGWRARQRCATRARV